MPNPKVPFGTWSLNPIWDFLYLRIGGPVMFGNHVITGLLILAIPIYYSIKYGYSKVPIWLMMMFATVFIHEMVIQSFGYIPYGNLVIHQILTNYMLYLGIFALIAVIFGNKFQRQNLFIVLITCILVPGMAMILYRIVGYYPMTLSQFSPGPQLMNFWANLLENIYWLAAILPWFVRRK